MPLATPCLKNMESVQNSAKQAPLFCTRRYVCTSSSVSCGKECVCDEFHTFCMYQSSKTRLISPLRFYVYVAARLRSARSAQQRVRRDSGTAVDKRRCSTEAHRAQTRSARGGGMLLWCCCSCCSYMTHMHQHVVLTQSYHVPKPFFVFALQTVRGISSRARGQHTDRYPGDKVVRLPNPRMLRQYCCTRDGCEKLVTRTASSGKCGTSFYQSQHEGIHSSSNIQHYHVPM